MGITILSRAEQAALRTAGRVAAETLARIGELLCAGMSTLDIDRLVADDTTRRGGTCAQLGHHGFPAHVCTSRNHVVCHGIPRADEVLRHGDIINVDVTTCYRGYHGDTSATFTIGEVPAATLALVDTARRCRDAGIDAAGPDARLGDIGHAITRLADAAGMSVVREYGGHGIGRTMHAPPHVSHVGRRGQGKRLRAGMAITVEPMLNLGAPDVVVLDDGWTVVTRDGSLSSQFEHTILITEHGPDILTRL